MPQLLRHYWFTALLIVAWLGLLAYIVATGSIRGYIILAVIAVFVLLPAFLLTVLTRADARRLSLSGPESTPALEEERREESCGG